MCSLNVVGFPFSASSCAVRSCLTITVSLGHRNRRFLGAVSPCALRSVLLSVHLIVSGRIAFSLANLRIPQGQPRPLQPQCFSASNLCLPPSKHSFISGTKAMHDIMEESSPAIHVITARNFCFLFILSSSPPESLL